MPLSFDPCHDSLFCSLSLSALRFLLASIISLQHHAKLPSFTWRTNKTGPEGIQLSRDRTIDTRGICVWQEIIWSSSVPHGNGQHLLQSKSSRDFLPTNKQYLITRGVPSLKRINEDVLRREGVNPRMSPT